MLRFILNENFRKKVSILLVVSMIFCTNSFDSMSRVFANGNEQTEVESTEVEQTEAEQTEIEIVTESVNDVTENANTDSSVSPEAENESEETENEELENEEPESEEPESEEPAVDESETSLDAETIENENIELVEEDEEVSTPSDISDEENTDAENVEAESDETENPNSTTIDETTVATDITNDEEVATISTDSEIDTIVENLMDNVATESDVVNEVENVVEDDYTNLSSVEQINYNLSDAVVMDGNIIKLEKDVELTKPIYFKDGYDLDLAGHSIFGPTDNYAIYVENNFTLYNDAENIGKIEGRNNAFPTMYVKDAVVELNKGIVMGSNEIGNGGDAIHLYESDFTISGGVVSGGRGESSTIHAGGNGGNAIVVVTSKNNNTILITSGGVNGGTGGKGVGNIKPEAGSAINVEGKAYDNEYLGKGLPGDVGGGNGGIGIYVKTDKFKSDNLTYEYYTINAGHAGYSNVSLVRNRSNAVILENNTNYGVAPTDNYFNLHKLDGVNYLTSFKYQNPTGLCTAFSTVAYAETNLIKNYPDFVKNVLGKNIDATHDLSTWDSNTSELDLSEVQFGMQMFVQPRDEFGNAGNSKYVADITNPASWANDGGNPYRLALTSSTWRSLVEEDDTIK